VNIKTTLKSSVAVAALFAVAVPVANAADDTLKSGNKNSLTVNGQVVRAMFWADDGDSSKLFQSGGDWTASRVRWIAQGSLSANVTAGATIEMNIPVSNEPGNMTLGGEGVDGVNFSSDGGWDIRQDYVWVNHKKFGKLTLGNTDGASNGRAETDYSGTTIFANSDGDSYGSGITFVETSTTVSPSASSVTVGEAFSNYDGASRDDVLRYDTPRFYGLQLAASMIAGGSWDVGADYQGKFGPFKVRAQGGFLDNSAQGASNGFIASGSISVLHDSGLNATFAAGKQNYAGAASKVTTTSGELEGVEDPHMYYFGVGYQAKIFGVGGTNFGVGYQQTNDASQDSGIDDSEAENWQVKVVQNFDAIGAKIGIEYMNYSFSANNGTVAKSFDDVDVISLMTVFAF
jgi:hypothetical protein